MTVINPARWQQPYSSSSGETSVLPEAEGPSEAAVEKNTVMSDACIYEGSGSTQLSIGLVEVYNI